MHLNNLAVVSLSHRQTLLFFDLCHEAKPGRNFAKQRNRERRMEGGIIQSARKKWDRHLLTESARFMWLLLAAM